jgi:hypothetical protein
MWEHVNPSLVCSKNLIYGLGRDKNSTLNFNVINIDITHIQCNGGCDLTLEISKIHKQCLFLYSKFSHPGELLESF